MPHDLDPDSGLDSGLDSELDSGLGADADPNVRRQAPSAAPAAIVQFLVEEGFAPVRRYNAHYAEFDRMLAVGDDRVARLVVRVEKPNVLTPVPRFSGVSVTEQRFVPVEQPSAAEGLPEVVLESLMRVFAFFAEAPAPTVSLLRRPCARCGKMLSEFVVRDGRVLCLAECRA